jgi:hypothetical protein
MARQISQDEEAAHCSGLCGYPSGLAQWPANTQTKLHMA